MVITFWLWFLIYCHCKLLLHSDCDLFLTASCMIITVSISLDGNVVVITLETHRICSILLPIINILFCKAFSLGTLHRCYVAWFACCRTNLLICIWGVSLLSCICWFIIFTITPGLVMLALQCIMVLVVPLTSGRSPLSCLKRQDDFGFHRISIFLCCPSPLLCQGGEMLLYTDEWKE